MTYVLSLLLFLGSFCVAINIMSYLCLCAAQLSLLLYVCFFSNSSLHLRLCHFSSVHQGSDGWWSGHSLESNERISCICDTNGLLFHLSVVCWGTNWLPFVPYRHKPGQFSFCKFVVLALFFTDFSFCIFVLLAWCFAVHSSFILGLV